MGAATSLLRVLRRRPCAPAPSSARFTLDQVLGAPFPSELTAVPDGAKVAWISNARGVRNILVAEPPHLAGAQDYLLHGRRWAGTLGAAMDAGRSAIVYVRGMGANGAGESQSGPRSEGRRTGHLDGRAGGGAPRKLAEGDSPAVSPKGDRVAYLHRGQIWLAALEGSAAPAQAFQARGAVRAAGLVARMAPGWHSPAAAAITASSACTMSRRARSATWIPAPITTSTRSGRLTAHAWRSRGTRQRSARRPRGAARRAALVDPGGLGRDRRGPRNLARASRVPGASFASVTPHQFMWADGDRLVFPWEADGWTHLYSSPRGRHGDAAHAGAVRSGGCGAGRDPAGK